MENKRNSLILIACLVVFLFTACSNTKPIESVDKDTTLSSDSSESILDENELVFDSDGKNGDEDEEPGAENDGIEDSQVLDVLKDRYPNSTILTWGYNDTETLSPGVKLAVNDELNRLGYSFIIDFQEYTSEGYSDKVNELINSDNPPDIICAGLATETSPGGTYNAYNNGWFLCLDDYFNSEEGKLLKESLPASILDRCKINGSYYGVSSFLPMFSSFCYLVNGDLMQKYGIEKEDIEGLNIKELGDIFSLVDEEKDTCKIFTPFDSSSPLDLVAGLDKIYDCNGYICQLISIDCYNDTDRIINILESTNVQDYILAVNDYNKKGYIADEKDSFFLVVTNDDISTSFVKSRINRVKELYPSNRNIVVVQSDSYVLKTLRESITGVCSVSKNQQLALRALNATMTEKTISDLLIYGVERVDYQIVEDKVRCSTFTWFSGIHFGNRFISMQETDEPDNKEEVLTDFYNSMPRSSALGVYLDFTEVKDKIDEINSIYKEYSSLFKGNSENPQADIEELNARLKEAGIDEVLEELNRQLKEKS